MCDQKSMWWSLFLCLVFFGPLQAQQDPPSPQCCPDIFLAGYNIGCAAGLCEWQINNASLTTCLTESARLIQQAHTDCSRVNPAWSGWRQHVMDIERMAKQLATTSDPNTVLATASGLYGLRDSLAHELRVQIVANRTVSADTCEDVYFRLGFELGFAQVALAVAGNAGIAQPVRTRAIQTAGRSVFSARAIIDSIAEVRPVTGRCVNLESLKADLAGVKMEPALEEAALTGSLVQRVVGSATQLLQGCGSGGGGASLLSPQAIAGVWQVRVSRQGPDGNWTTSADDEILELTATPGRFGMLIGMGKLEFTHEWLIRGNEIHLVDQQGQTKVRYRLVNANVMLMLELHHGPNHFIDREDDGVRIELQR